MKLSDKIYWYKVGAAFFMGVLCTVLKSFMGFDGTLVFMIGTLLYISISEGLAVLTKVDRNRVLKIGIGIFIFLWILTWTLLNTLLVSS